MGASSLRAGQHLRIQGADFTILRKLEGQLWQLESTKTRRIKEYSTTTLMEFYHGRDMIFVGSEREIIANGPGLKINTITKEQWEGAKVRRLLVHEVLHLPSTKRRVQPIIERKWSRLGFAGKCPSASSVLRWKRNYVRSNGDLSSLVDQTFRKGNRTARYEDAIFEIVRDAIDEIYLTLERKTRQDVLDEAKYRIRKENELRPKQLSLPFPSHDFVKSRIAEIPAFDRIAARHGRTAATKRFREVLGHHVADYPLERAEIDHTPLDLIVIDDETFLPLGRPWLTVCLDVRTRCVLGIYLGFEPPSYLSVARCLKHAFLPKTDLRERYKSIENDWLPHGVMRELVVDNGQEFHSKSLENACFSLGTEIIYSARKTPWHKGKVERFQKTLNDEVAHGTPGTTFSNILDKDDYDPAKHAIVRYIKILEIVNKWVADVYHQRCHRSLQVSPQQDWVSSVASEDIMLPNDPTVLDALLGRSEERVLTHKGVELDCLTYNSPELTSLRKRYGEKLRVQLRIDDADIGQIAVICPHTGDLFGVPAVRADYASGISRWQHEVFKNFAATQDDRSDPEAWLEAKHAISKMVEEEFLVKRKGTRSRVARFKHAANGVSGPTDQPDERPAKPEEGPLGRCADSLDQSLVVDVEDVLPSEDIGFKPIAPVVSISDDRLANREAS